MNAINDRAREVKEAVCGTHYGSIKLFAEKLDWPYSTTQSIIAGTMTLSVARVAAIVTDLNVNADWLLTGRGSMFLDNRTPTD